MITLITMTGARPGQFDLCQQFMHRQTYTGEVTWIIVDDCIPRTTNKVTKDFRTGWTIIKIYPEPKWLPGMNTQGRNIRAGLDAVAVNCPTTDAIFIIEDDDYYRAIYLEAMMSRFQNYYAIGEIRTIYYNVKSRQWFVNPNEHHASLFQTAFRMPLFDAMWYSTVVKFIDAQFWATATNTYLFAADNLAIGMKGMPGRAGIGAGHKESHNLPHDDDLKYLQKLIGNDTKFYENYHGDYHRTQYDILNKKML
jgi:hypothetical protein